MEDSLRELAQAQAAAAPTPERDRTGERLGRFQITGLLGRGGMGVVYAALDLTLRRKVALKLLQPEAVGSDEQRRRFVREARAAAAVSHPNIAQIYEVGEAEGEVFLALELVEGSPLRERLRQAAGALPEAEARRIAREIARGLATAHEAGVVHRDVKPENVMLTPDGRVKILDFGLAKLHGAPNAHDGPTASAITTHAGLIVGSPGYMAPEQARGLPTDPRSDVFSLGIVLFEMLAGNRPFQGPTSIDILSAILRDEPPALRGVSGSLNAVVARCLEKDPAARYANASALLADLETLPAALRWRPRLPPGLARRLAASETLAAWRSLQLRHRAVVVSVTLLSTAATWFLLRGPKEAAPEPTTLVGKPAPAGAPIAITELPRPSSSNERAIEAYQDALQYFRDADWVKARASLRRSLELDKDLAAAHLRLAIALSSPDRLFSEPVAEAFQAYSSATHLRDRLSPHDRGMLEALEPAMRAGSLNMAEAVARLARLTERYPDDAEVAQLYASYLTFGPPDAQLAAAERALRIDGKYADAWQAKGTALARQKSPDELAAYAQCLAIVPTSSDCWWSRAMAESRLGRCAAAETSFRRRAEDDANTLPELAGLLYAQGKPLEAVQEVLKRTWALYDADVAREEELYDRARLNAAYGDFDAARSLATQAQALVGPQRPLGAQARFTLLLVEIELEVGRAEKAAALAQAFLNRRDGWPKHDGSMAESDPTVYLARVAARPGTRSGDVQARRNVWYQEKRPGTPLEHAWAWWLTYAQGIERPDEASEALAARPKGAPWSNLHPWMDDGLGRSLWLGGKPTEARPHLESAFKRCDQFATVLSATRTNLLYGQALEAQRDREGACEVYRSILARWGKASPRSVTAEEATKRVQALGCARPPG